MDGHLAKPYRTEHLRQALDLWAPRPGIRAPGAGGEDGVAVAATSPVADGSAAPLRDMPVVLQEALAAGGSERVRELIDLFLESGAERVESVTAAVAGGDMAAAAMSAHALRGGALALEELRLAHAAAAIEDHAVAADGAGGTAPVLLAEEVDEAFRVARARLLAFHGQLASTDPQGVGQRAVPAGPRAGEQPETEVS